MEFINVDGVSFRYGNENENADLVLDDIRLTIQPGEFVALLGHNGCGKSTLAKHFNAMLLPTGGKVWVDGKDTSEEENKYPVRRLVGMVLQNPDNQLVSSIVEEDVAFGPENLGIPSEEIRQRVDNALKAVGMYDYRLHAPDKLSGGQKQRVAIAGILAMEPSCIVLDEPTAMLDRPPPQPGAGNHSGAYHPLYGGGRRSGPRGGHGRRPGADGRHPAAGVFPGGGPAAGGTGCASAYRAVF